MSKTRNLMHFSHNISKKEKFSLINNLLSKEKIEDLLQKQNHSFGMIRDLLQRDYINENTDEIIKKVVSCKQTFASILKSNDLHFDVSKYNKMPQSWKLQYRFPKQWTEKEVQHEIATNSAKGQLKTVQIRKKKDKYNNFSFQKKWSPFVLEFYLSRGFTEDYAKKRIAEICSSGAKVALKVTQSPKTESKIAQILFELQIPFSRQFTIKNDSNEDKRLRFIYDFLLPDTKTIIEVNGDFFHANPNFYDENDLIPLPSGMEKSKTIWERDKRKVDFALSKGYSVLVFWEHEINYRIETIKERLLNV